MLAININSRTFQRDVKEYTHMKVAGNIIIEDDSVEEKNQKKL